MTSQDRVARAAPKVLRSEGLGLRLSKGQRSAVLAKRGRGRPPEGERVEVRIPAKLLARIDSEAKRADVSRAEQVRRIVANHYSS